MPQPCIQSLLDNIDLNIMNQLKIDRKLAYGLVTRYTVRTAKKIVNIVDNEKSPYYGQPALWDDRFDCIWFHRILLTRVDTTHSDYGSKRYTLVEDHSVSTVVWSKKDSTWLGDPIFISQASLYENFIAILNQEGLIEFEVIDLDQPLVESEEFFEQGISTESNLIRFNYRMKITKSTACVDANCFPKKC